MQRNPPLTDLLNAFHVDNDGLSFSDHPAAVHSDLDLKAVNVGNSWKIDFKNHYDQDSLSTCTYYIKTSLASGNRADAIIIEAVIYYNMEN
jgi:hypothetical protein